MRVKQPEPFDKDREYKIGERVIYQGKTLICVKYTPTPKWLIEKFGDMYFQFGMLPTQCGMCRIKEYKDCKGVIDSPCFRYSRLDRKNINFQYLRTNKNERK